MARGPLALLPENTADAFSAGKQIALRCLAAAAARRSRTVAGCMVAAENARARTTRWVCLVIAAVAVGDLLVSTRLHGTQLYFAYTINIARDDNARGARRRRPPAPRNISRAADEIRTAVLPVTWPTPMVAKHEHIVIIFNTNLANVIVGAQSRIS